MTRIVWLISLFLLVAACTPGEEPDTDDINLDEVIVFPDPKMESFIRNRAYLEADEPITVRKVKKLIYLECISCGITDLTGLEKMPWVKELDLSGNPIVSLDPLNQLISLEKLAIGGAISSLAPLSDCQEITVLNVSGQKKITDISFLAKMTKMERLYISGNMISEISVVSSMTKLKSLVLGENPISDITAIMSLLELDLLDVHDACISDFSPIEYLKQNGKLTSVNGATAEEQDYARCQ